LPATLISRSTDFDPEPGSIGNLDFAVGIGDDARGVQVDRKLAERGGILADPTLLHVRIGLYFELRRYPVAIRRSTE
jgi:hypothetical protein